MRSALVWSCSKADSNSDTKSASKTVRQYKTIISPQGREGTQGTAQLAQDRPHQHSLAPSTGGDQYYGERPPQVCDWCCADRAWPAQWCSPVSSLQSALSSVPNSTLILAGHCMTRPASPSNTAQHSTAQSHSTSLRHHWQAPNKYNLILKHAVSQVKTRGPCQVFIFILKCSPLRHLILHCIVTPSHVLSYWWAWDKTR